MGKVTIYLDHLTETKMKTMIKKNGLSKSKWIADLIRERPDPALAGPYTKNGWGLEGYADCRGNPKNMGADSEREPV